MKTLLLKLLPGVLACLGVTLGIGLLKAQAPATAPAVVAPVACPAPMPMPYTVCGNCGAQIAAPQAVWIAAPVQGERRGAPPQFGGQSFYGIPPVGYIQPYADPACYVDPYRRGADEQRFDLPAPRRFYR